MRRLHRYWIFEIHVSYKIPGYTNAEYSSGTFIGETPIGIRGNDEKHTESEFVARSIVKGTKQLVSM